MTRKVIFNALNPNFRHHRRPSVLHSMRRELINTRQRRIIPRHIRRTHRRRRVHRHGTRKLIDIHRRCSVHWTIPRTHCRTRGIHRHGTYWSTHISIRIVRINLHVRRSRRLLRHRIVVSSLSIGVVELRDLVILLWRRHLLYLSDAYGLLFVPVVLGWWWWLWSLRLSMDLGLGFVALPSEKEEDSEDDGA
jgi:hypothetical protein